MPNRIEEDPSVCAKRRQREQPIARDGFRVAIEREMATVVAGATLA